jgi:hypothetical protein
MENEICPWEAEVETGKISVIFIEFIAYFIIFSDYR